MLSGIQKARRKVEESMVFLSYNPSTTIPT